MNTIAIALQAATAPAVSTTLVGASPVRAVSLDSIVLDPKARSSINYAKARMAIEAAYPKRAERRAAKLAVVQHLGGTIVHPKAIPPQKTPLPNFVQFDDSSKARF